MSIYNVGNLRKVTTSTPNNNVASAKLKFGGNQANEDVNGANKPVKVSSSISEKIKKLSSSTSSNEIAENGNISSTTPQQQTPLKNGLNTNGKDKKPAATPSVTVENGSKPNGTTNGTKLSNTKPSLSGNISTYITSEVSATAIIKTVNVNEKANEPSDNKVEKKLIINEISPTSESSISLNKQEPLVPHQLDIGPKTPANTTVEVKNVKLANKAKITNGASSTAPPSSKDNLETNLEGNFAKDSDELSVYRQKLAEADFLNKQLKLENDTLQEELQDIRHEMEELQDQFRVDDADEFRQLQSELEIAAKNCRILQFKLRKLEKRNESLETEKILLQDKLEDFNRDTQKVIDLEEELLIAKEVSIRLHSELEQSQEWRLATERLNKELKKQLDDLKDYLDSEIKGRNNPHDYNEMVLVNKLYESMFREYFLQEQLYSVSNSSQSLNVTKQLREVTDLLNSYQQKIAIFNDEIGMLKQQIAEKDREINTFKLQLKNLKRSRSTESNYERNKIRTVNDNKEESSTGSSETEDKKMAQKTADEILLERNRRSMSVDGSDTLMRQYEIAKDELKLLRNKIARLEDDLISVTQERDGLTSQLEKIEDKAMKSFTTIVENETDTTDLELDSVVIKQMNELKKKIDQLNVEAKQNDETKNQLSDEIKQLREKLDEKMISPAKKMLNGDKEIVDYEEENKKVAKEEIIMKKGDENEIETIKNLTDADKLLRDEYKLLKLDLDDKNDIIAKMQIELQQNFSFINEIKKTIEIKEANLSESINKEKLLHEKLDDSSKKLATLNKKIDEYESSFVQLKNDLSIKKDIEKELQNDNQRLNTKINDFSSQLKEKMSEIEFLNRENVSLQDRINADDKKINLIETEKNELKQKLANLKTDLDKKSTELNKFDNLVKSKEIELGKTNRLITNKEQAVQKKLEEYEKNKIELTELRTKYDDLRSNLEDKVSVLNKEIDRLNQDKEKLFQDLNEVKTKHSHCKESNAQSIESEIDHEKAVLQKLENQALNAKYETKIQYLEVEIDTLRSKIKKLLREKEAQEQVLKENQLLVKEIALKYASDSDSWNRQKIKLLEKEKLYEESVDMRKELKKAADKLRLKLQSLEEQIIDKQNKHTIEKNSWETQRLQYVTSKNKLEEQLSKLSTLKRSKKEIEFAWDKERRDLNSHVENLEASIKDLQLQLNQRNATMAQISDQYAQNEKIQSLFGENEFLKNRIKELEIMLDEMEQVKRFLFDVKDAYETDRHEWALSKEEFRNLLELKEGLWLDCNMRLNEIVNVIRAIQMNEPLPTSNMMSLSSGFNRNGLNLMSNSKDSSLNEAENAKNESLNNLVGGATTSLLDYKFGNKLQQFTAPMKTHHNINYFYQQQQQQQQISDHHSKLNIANLKTIEELNGNVNRDHNDDLQLIDVTKDRKELDCEFEQALKKIDRVKDNFSTHKKFMDIVKSKSMKALNRKSSSTSLQMTSCEPLSSNESSRGSVPPEQKIITSSSSKGARAKSVSKEPAPRDDSQNGSLSRFFSLSRRIAKIRFSSSSQPPPPLKSPLLSDDLQDVSNSSNMASLNGIQKTQSTQLLSVPSQEEDSSNKKNARERALSPSKFLNKLRPRSPFGRTNRNSAVSGPIKLAKSENNSDNQTLATTLVSPSTRNKSFTVSASNSPLVDNGNHFSRTYGLMSASYHSESLNSNSNLDDLISSPTNRLTRATTAVPSSMSDRSGLNEDISSLSTDKLRSLSCEFIDNSSMMPNTKANKMMFGFKELNETLDENDESYADNNSILTASSYSNAMNSESQQSKTQAKPVKKVFSLSTGTGSKVEALRKNFMESTNNNTSTNSHEIVKSVKFKEPPEKADQLNNNDSPAESVSLNESNSNVHSEKDVKKLNVKFDDKTVAPTNDKPPKGPLLTNTPSITVSSFNFRNKLTGKSRTIDFPDLLQNAMVGDSSSSSPSTQLKSNGAPLTSNGKPIQSILRRSETPPSTRSNNLRQTSIESNHSARETSIEKLLKQTSSTSRPLMFNN